MEAFTASCSFTVDSESFLSKSLLGIKTSSQSTKFGQLNSFVLRPGKINLLRHPELTVKAA
jgi:hypothetical protein